VAFGVPRPSLLRRCVVNLDWLATIPKRVLARRLATLGPVNLALVERALRFALGIV
jgi:mRNA-degrading endonuclease toxin of MazEF toxin-antitoxin module